MCQISAKPITVAKKAQTNPVGELRGDGARVVGTAVEDDDDLIGEAQALETGGELRRLVVDDDERRETLRLDHAAAPPMLRHRRRAAASAASTVSESIIVPVVR